MDTKVQLDETLDYKIKAKRQSYYRFQKVVQNTGAESVTIGAAQQVSTFEIPAVPLSLARSHLNFETTSVAQGGGAYAHLFRSTVPWSRVELFTRSGVYLMDVTNFAEMFLTVAQRTKSVEEFHTSDFDVLSRTGINDVTTKKYASSGADLAHTVSWRVAFRELYDTVLSVDKSIHFNEVLNLRITWREAQAHGYQSDNANPTAGTPADLTGNITVSNLALYIAAESNPDVVASLAGLVASGNMPPILMPYPFVYKTNITNQSSHAISARFSRGYGRMLERVFTRFQNNDETKNNRYTAALSGTEIVSFYSLLDSRRMTEFDIVVGNQDYHWMREREHAGKVVGLDIANDIGDFAWADSWCQNDVECARKGEIAGLSLEGSEVKYDMYINCNGAQSKNYYMIAITQRMLQVTPSGLIVS
jgi:hypothetical protein